MSRRRTDLGAMHPAPIAIGIAALWHWFAPVPLDDAPSGGPAGPARVLACFELAARIPYREDPADHWQSPLETVVLCSGDCEDKALYLQHLLQGAGLDAELAFGVADWDASDRLHAWVETEICGEVYVLDPTQGFLARRDNIAPGGHVPVLGMPGVLRCMREYVERTGSPAVSRHYQYMLDLARSPDERIASR